MEQGLELMKKALERARDEQLFQQWVVQLPVMATSGEYVSFEAYRDRLTGANIDRRPMIEIMAELEEVEKELSEGGSL